MNRPVHFEILGDDPAKLSEFYSSIFGWKIAALDGPQGYWLATTGEGERGIDGGFIERHFPQAVINTIEVESMDACLISSPLSDTPIFAYSISALNTPSAGSL